MKFVTALILLSGLFAVFMMIPRGEASVEGVNAPVVAELFTSQSCSSCPPADRVLGQLAENNNIIALSCHVTYWNHLHWEDTLSKQFCTQRQRDYVRSLKARGSYTPQIVINGRYEMVGSRGGRVSNAVKHASENTELQEIGLSLDAQTLHINLPSLEQKDNQTKLILIPFGKKHTQNIPSGENRGRTVSYTNPVQGLIALSEWNGNSKTLSRDISALSASGGYAVLAQDIKTGAIVAAGQVKL